MNSLNNERGAVLVFVAMGLVLFVLFLGVALDTGWTVYVRSQGQARVDSAALAGASGLFDQDAADRETAAKDLSVRFSDTENPVLTTETDRDGDVIPMHYNPVTKALTEAPSWAPATNGDYVNNVGCNAVQVSNVVPTPLFFSGVRNVFGAGETGSTNLNVNATGYLGCPGGALVDGPGYAPIAIRSCRFSDLDTSCNREVQLWQTSNGKKNTDLTDNSLWTTLFQSPSAKECRDLVNGEEPPVEVDMCDTIRTNNGATNCLCEMKQRYGNCTKAICDAGGPAADACSITVPVVDTGCNDDTVCGAATQSASSGKVISWAKICLTKFYRNGNCPGLPKDTVSPCLDQSSTQCLFGQLRCGQSIPGTTTTAGQCFGSSASNPVLVQ